MTALLHFLDFSASQSGPAVAMASVGSFWLYAGFTGLVLLLLALDLGVFHRQAHVVSFREALVWSVVWVGLALAFNGWVCRRARRS